MLKTTGNLNGLVQEKSHMLSRQTGSVKCGENSNDLMHLEMYEQTNLGISLIFNFKT